MTEETGAAPAGQQQPEPSPDLRALDRLVGTWEIAGGTRGPPGTNGWRAGFFLVQHVDLEQYGQQVKGIEIIGHERPFGAEPSEEIPSRFYDNMGDTLDYAYELPQQRDPQTRRLQPRRGTQYRRGDGVALGTSKGCPTSARGFDVSGEWRIW